MACSVFAVVNTRADCDLHGIDDADDGGIHRQRSWFRSVSLALEPCTMSTNSSGARADRIDRHECAARWLLSRVSVVFVDAIRLDDQQLLADHVRIPFCVATT